MRHLILERFARESLYFVAFSVLFLGAVCGVKAVDPGRTALSGHVPSVVSTLSPNGRLPATNQVYLAIGLPLRNQTGLGELEHQLYDPASTNFHKYLIPQEFTARFGPTEDDYRAVMEFARTNDLSIVETHDDRKLLDVTGSAADIERAFQITLHTYRHPSEARDFFAPDPEPSVPNTLPVADIQGLSDYGRPHPMLHPQPALQGLAGRPNFGSGSGGTYFGGDFRAAYVPGTTLNGSNQIVGLVQFDGFYSNDITSYETQAGLPAVPLQTILLDGFSGTPTTGANSGNPEVSLDIEMVISMAPGISTLMVYEGNPNNFIPNDVLSQIASDDLAEQVSSSWSWNGGPSATTDSYLLQMIVQGQSVFFASGDSDAYTGANAPDTSSAFTIPITSTNVTAVGGTTLSTSGPLGAWTGETVWNWNNSGQPDVGSSGGTSTYYTIPWWQTNTTTVGNNRSTTFRNLPDVALTADNIYVLYGNGNSGTFGGTSCAAPLWAGFTALVNQQAAFAAKPPVGFLPPALYALAAGPNYNSCFHDITTGNNIGSNTPGLYNAVAGFDLCTGLGTPNGTNLINALAPVVFAPVITSAGWTLLAESAVPANGAIDPGETVTVGFTLQNQGNLATANLVATLLVTTNILTPSSPQTYGALAGSGGTTSEAFTFTAAGNCGSTIVATLQLQDGANNLGTVNFNLPLGKLVAVQSLAQNFDAVTAPALPSSWTSVNITGTATNWTTVTGTYDTAPNSVFIPDVASTSENALVSPVIAIASTNAQLTFRHDFSFDYHSGGSSHYRDGGVLQIQIGSGGFSDILSAGGSFVTGGYNNSITATSNPLGTVPAWVHSSSGWQTVTVNLPPSVAGQNIQLRWVAGTDLSNTGSGAIGWYVDSISLTDSVPNCLSVFTDVAIGQSLAAGSLQSGQNLIYTLAVTNLGPQSAANVVVTDTIPANASYVSAPGGNYSGGQVVFNTPMLPVNSVTNFTFTLAPASGNVFTNVATVATVTPEAGATNTSTTLVSTQTSTLQPVIVVPPGAQTTQCGSNASFTVTATGAPPLNYQWSLDGTAIPAATGTNLLLTNVHLPSHTVTVVVTNLYGSTTSSVPLTVKDTLPPAITLNGANPFYVSAGSAYVEPGATAYDLCAGAVPVTISGAVNTNVISTNTVTYTATDGNGNTNTATRTVIVRDTTPPTIVWVFTNLVLAANSNCVAPMPNITGTNYIIATDTYDALTITQSPTNSAALPLGTNVVVITVADASGNKSYSTNFIAVRDVTPPNITLKGFNTLTNQLGAPFTDPGATASDNCSGIALLTTNGTVNVNAVGTNFLTYTAVDGSGNTNTVTRTVIVQDTTPPTIVWSFTNLTLAANSNCAASMPNVTSTNYIIATDADDTLTISMPNVTSTNYIIATDADDTLTITQNPTNSAALPLGTNVVIITVADLYGNKSYSTNSITVLDVTPPNITLNGFNPMTNQLGTPFTDPGVTASDTCSSIALLTTNGTINVNAVGTNLLTYTAVDGSGNTNTVTRIVIVQDTTPPTIVWSFTNLVLAANSNCVAPMPNVTGTNYLVATDANDTLTITQSPTNNATLLLGTNVVVITVADLYGNTSFSTNSIVVLDVTPPNITLNGFSPMTNQLGTPFTDPGVTASDTCSGIALLITNGTVNVNAVGTNLLTYTAVDGSGNTNTVTRIVFVQDTTPPTIVWSFTNLVLAANSNCVAPMPDVTGTNYIIAMDLSGVAAISQSPTNGTTLPLGTSLVVIAATDAYSNTAYSTNTVLVRDETPPVILAQPQSQTNNAGATATFNIAATACTPLTFQWWFDSAALTAQTNNALILSNLTSPSAGNYSVVVSASGGSVTSAVATLTVYYVPPGISAVAARPGTGIVLSLTGTPGDTYVLQGTTNLSPPINWFPIATNTLDTNGLWQYTDLQATNYPLLFYRLMFAP